MAINGRKQLTQDEVLAIGGVNGRSSLLFLSASAVREKLKASPWISDATVLKLYPGQLRIDIVERTAFALWQRDGHLAVIADDGRTMLITDLGSANGVRVRRKRIDPSAELHDGDRIRIGDEEFTLETGAGASSS